MPPIDSQIAGREESVLCLHGDGSGVEIHHRGLDERVAKLFFDGENVRPADQHLCGERMPKQMRMDALGARPFGYDTQVSGGPASRRYGSFGASRTAARRIRRSPGRDGHLPDIPTEAEVNEKGVSLGEMQARLLAKIEELTVDAIQADERIRRLEEENAALQPGSR